MSGRTSSTSSAPALMTPATVALLLALSLGRAALPLDLAASSSA